MGGKLRKPDIILYEQQRRTPGCAYTQPDQ